MSSNRVCDHDWRVDPYVMLPSNPPRRRLVCARCGTRQVNRLRDIVKTFGPVQGDPATWPKYKEGPAQPSEKKGSA